MLDIVGALPDAVPAFDGMLWSVEASAELRELIARFGEPGNGDEALQEIKDAISEFEPRSIDDLRAKARFALDNLYRAEFDDDPTNRFLWNVIEALA